jgi:restriction endonuclease Mrr
MQTFSGNTVLRFRVGGRPLEGVLLRASLRIAEVLIPSSLQSDVYWKNVHIDFPKRIDGQAIRVLLVPKSSIPQQILHIRWNLNRKQILELAVETSGAESVYEHLAIPHECKEIIIDSNTLITERIRNYLSKHPEMLYRLSPRAFEELVADVLASLGLEVVLTPATRDGGIDIYAYVTTQVARFMMVIECKKRSPDKPVGIDVVQRLYGVQQSVAANKSILVTTSHFTGPAIQQCKQYKGLMELKDFANLKELLLASHRPFAS